jgi:hypothetical protein
MAKPKAEAAVEVTKTDIFVVFNGRRIAKRGHPGTKHAGT